MIHYQNTATNTEAKLVVGRVVNSPRLFFRTEQGEVWLNEFQIRHLKDKFEKWLIEVGGQVGKITGDEL